MHFNVPSTVVHVVSILVLYVKVKPVGVISILKHMDLYTSYPHGTDLTSTNAANCSDGDIRLAQGPNVREGRVEICLNNAWGTVCAQNVMFSPASAQVVCQQTFSGSIISSETLIVVFLYLTAPFWP